MKHTHLGEKRKEVKTMKFGKMFKTILSLLLVLAMLVACAPAAEENNNNPGDSNNPSSSGTPGGITATLIFGMVTERRKPIT